MNSSGSLVRLDQLSSSYLVILILTLGAVTAGWLFWIGLIGWAVGVIAAIVREGIRIGFEVWKRLFAWASWPVFLSIMSASLLVGWMASGHLPLLTIICALLPLFMGVTACLAYMLIDLDRYAVSRGYKSVHNPLKGQELAVNLVQYGQAVGIPLLVSASIGMVGGFALLNLGLYETVGRNWYLVKEGQPDPTYIDFVANALIVLLKIVDVLDFARASHVLDVAYVRQIKWPSSTLLAAFRMFFTLVLLQQVFASVRRGQVLSETITDLWNPNEPIHLRACSALPQHGPGAVDALLISLGRIPSVTKEQRERLPVMLAAIGPAAVPFLVRHLHHSNEYVRAIAAAALGHLRVRGTVVLLVSLCRDSSDVVRQSLIEALGIIASPGVVPAEAKLAIVPLRHRLLRSLRWKQQPIHVSHVDPVELAVKTLQSALVDESLTVRAQAARALGRIGPGASVAAMDLLALCKDEDETVRKEAIDAIGNVGGPTAAVVTALAELLDDPCPTLRAAAAKALGTLGKSAAAAFPAMSALLQDREEFVRDAAAEAIGQIGDIDLEAADELSEGLTSPDSLVRAQTAEALGTIGETAHEAAPALVEALDDENDMVRAKAVEALGKIGEGVGDLAVPGLVRALRDEDNTVSSLAAEALGEMGESGDAAIPSLIRSLRHMNPEVRAKAAESLGKLNVNTDEIADPLERLCQDEDANVRSQAIRALSMIDDPKASTRKTIIDGLRDTDANVRAAAIEGVCQWCGAEESSPELFLPLLEDPNEQVRAQVTRAIPQLVGAIPAAIEGLCQRLREDTDVVQACAAQALGELGSAAAVAGQTLLRAAQTGESCVREKAIQAIRQIRPTENLTSIQNGEIEPDTIAALRAIEDQSEDASPQADVDIIPVVVAPLIDPDTGEPIQFAVTLVEQTSSFEDESSTFKITNEGDLATDVEPNKR